MTPEFKEEILKRTDNIKTSGLDTLEAATLTTGNCLDADIMFLGITRLIDSPAPKSKEIRNLLAARL